jgi:hypothetical protein
MKNGILLLNRVFKITFMKLLMYIYVKTRLGINFIFIEYIIDFILKTQINLMWFLKEFKVSEISYVTTFDTTCTPSFNTKCVYHTMKTPPMLYHPPTHPTWQK